MRLGEIKELRLSYIDRNKMMIRLPKDVTREGRSKDIPINPHVQAALESLPVQFYVITLLLTEENRLTAKVALRNSFR